jgi:hypothetical protein
MLLVLATATDHTLNVGALVIALAFGVGILGHIHHSRTLVLCGIFAIAAICLYFVGSGEISTFG